MGKQVLAEPNQTPEQRIAAMYETAYARPPPDEIASALLFLESGQNTAWTLPATRFEFGPIWPDVVNAKSSFLN
jgi:hypothetical protein